MTKASKSVKPKVTIIDPETGEELKIITRKRPETWMDKILREQGITVHNIEPPKGFVRVVFPGNPDIRPDGSPSDNEKS